MHEESPGSDVPRAAVAASPSSPRPAVFGHWVYGAFPSLLPSALLLRRIRYSPSPHPAALRTAPSRRGERRYTRKDLERPSRDGTGQQPIRSPHPAKVRGYSRRIVESPSIRDSGPKPTRGSRDLPRTNLPRPAIRTPDCHADQPTSSGHGQRSRSRTRGLYAPRRLRRARLAPAEDEPFLSVRPSKLPETFWFIMLHGP